MFRFICEICMLCFIIISPISLDIVNENDSLQKGYLIHNKICVVNVQTVGFHIVLTISTSKWTSLLVVYSWTVKRLYHVLECFRLCRTTSYIFRFDFHVISFDLVYIDILVCERLHHSFYRRVFLFFVSFFLLSFLFVLPIVFAGMLVSTHSLFSNTCMLAHVVFLFSSSTERKFRYIPLCTWRVRFLIYVAIAVGKWYRLVYVAQVYLPQFIG